MNTTAIASETKGGCCCGRIRFQTKSIPFQVSYCHCSDCRKATGAPVTVFVGFDFKKIIFTRYQPDIHNPAPTIKRLFCATCGTPIGYLDDRLANEVYFYSGALDDPSKFRPELHAWVLEQLDWLEIEDQLPHYDKFSRLRSSEE